jgi:hypothetical protein
MAKQTVRDVIGEPNGWSNCVSDELVATPAVNGATIVDVFFFAANEISIYWRANSGFETLSIFRISDPKIQEGLVNALTPGRFLLEALGAPLRMK